MPFTVLNFCESSEYSVDAFRINFLDDPVAFCCVCPFEELINNYVYPVNLFDFNVLSCSTFQLF